MSFVEQESSDNVQSSEGCRGQNTVKAEGVEVIAFHTAFVVLFACRRSHSAAVVEPRVQYATTKHNHPRSLERLDTALPA